jgi:hypothetical protein
LKTETKHLYITDLDGTLLRADETIEPAARKKLADMLSKGLNFTVASARSVVSIKEVLADLPIKLPVIEINGAFISDLHTGEHLKINAIDRDILPRLYNSIKEATCHSFMSTYNGFEDCLYHPEIANPGIEFYYQNRKDNKDKRLRPTNNPDECFNDYVVAFTVINEPHILKQLADKIARLYPRKLTTHLFENPYSPQWWWLTIHDKNACKSKAAAELAKLYGFGTDELTVFGDGYNDVEMFKKAARAIAVQNASEKLKSLAHKTIGPNHQSSVINFIEKEFQSIPS